MANAKKYEQFLCSGRFFSSCFVSLGFALFFGSCFSAYNFAVVCMVNNTALDSEENPNRTGCLLNKKLKKMHYDGEFRWSKDELSNVFAAYYWASPAVLLVVGLLIPKLGLKCMFLTAGAVSSISTLLLPLAAKYGTWKGTLAIRLVTGAFAATNRPLAVGFCANWATSDDRGIVTNVVANAVIMGSLIAQPLAALMCSTIGWEYIFYVFGGISLTWLLLATAFVTFEPESNRCISKGEKDFIVNRRASGKNQNRDNVSWIALLKSPAVYAALIPFLANRLMNNFSAMYVPTYLKEIIAVDVEVNGLFSALPFVAQILGRYLSGYAVDRLKVLSPTIRLKLFNTAGSLLGVGFLLGLCFVRCGEETLAVTLLVLYNFGTSLVNGGCVVAPLFFAPSCSAQVQVLFSFCLYISSIILPYIVTAVIAGGAATQWSYMFGGFAAFTLIGAIAFLIFGSGEPDASLDSEKHHDQSEKTLLDKDKA